MRKDVKKLLFFGLEQDKNSFFTKSQTLGMIQFIDQKNRKIAPSDPHAEILAQGIKILRGLPLKECHSTLPPLEMAREIIALKHRQDKLEEDLRILTLELERIKVFGDFSLEDIRYIEQQGKRRVQFFCARKEVEVQENLIYIASSAGLNYYLSIQPYLSTYPGMIEMKLEHSVHELQEMIRKNKAEHHVVHTRLASFTSFKEKLHQALYHALDHADLTFAKEGTHSAFDDQIFIATGFVPEDKIDTVLKCAKSFEIHAEEIAPDPEEVIPTYVENESVGKMGEDLVNIYDTPSNQDKDPSLWVFFAFLLFFSMIIGDGGYGSVFLGIALFLRYKFPDLDSAKKRLLNLFTLLCVGCIGWGILSSSFFGISLDPENPLRQVSIVNYLTEKKVAYHMEQKDQTHMTWLQKYPATLHETNPQQFILKGFVLKEGERVHELLSSLTDEVLMEISLFIGGIHILFGMLRYLRKNLSNIGWMIFLVGSYLYLPLYLGVPSLLNYVFGIPFEAGGIAGFQMICFGIPLAIVIAVFRNGLLGLAEVMNLIQVFADVLSYLRLYALGLSGSILSATINGMANSLPIYIAIFLIIMGHIINMVLGIMGGVIHGLRLNFIEWYHYSFEGGGKPFKPLKLKSGEST